MEKTIVRAEGAADFLAFVPRLLGYQPARSVVVVLFNQARSIGAMRFDLPPADSVQEVAHTIVGMAIRADGCTRIAAVVYTDEPGATTVPLLEALEARAEACGVDVADTLYVAADGWGSVLGGTGPNPLEEIPAHEELPPAAAGDQATGATLPEVTEEQRWAVAKASEDFGKAVAVLLGEARPEGDEIPPQMLALACMTDDIVQVYEDALDWPVEELPAEHGALLAWLMARPSLRDVALVQWAGTRDAGDEALSAQLQWESGVEYPTHLAMRMWGEGERPDHVRLEKGLALIRQVAALTDDEQRPGALSLCAWISWALGRSTHASAYAEQALAIDPHHGLSEIIMSFVSAGHLPDWAFRTQS